MLWGISVLQTAVPEAILTHTLSRPRNRLVFWRYSTIGHRSLSTPLWAVPELSLATAALNLSVYKQNIKCNYHVPYVSPAGAPSGAILPGRFSWWPAGNHRGPPGLMTSRRLTSSRYWGRRQQQQQWREFFPGPDVWWSQRDAATREAAVTWLRRNNPS